MDDDKFILQIEASLAIDEHALEDALLRQPDSLYRVCKRLALQTSNRDAAKQLLKETEAEADAQIRQEAEDKKEKVTETDVKSRKILHPGVKKAEQELLDLEYSVGRLWALKEAFQDRSKCLEGLVKLYLSNYYGTSQDSGLTRQVTEVKAQRVKAEIGRRS